MFISYGRKPSVLTTDAIFFRSPSNELVLRKAVYRTSTPKKKREEIRKRERQTGEKRTNRNKRKKKAQFIPITENVASLGMAIRKYDKNKIVKKDCQLLETKIGFYYSGERTTSE